MTKKSTLEFFENTLRKTKMSDTSICMILRTAHFILPYTCLFVLLFGNKFWFIMITLLCLVVCILFYLLDGCISTMLEYKFAKDDWTSLDPVLEICGIEVNNKNRKKISVYNFFMNTILICILYYLRFVRKPTQIGRTPAPWDKLNI